MFRRPAARKELICARFDHVRKDQTFPSGGRAEGSQLFLHESVVLRGTGNPWLEVQRTPLGPLDAPPPIRVVFDEVVVEVEVRFRARRGQAPVSVQAHDERGVVVESSTTFAVGSAGTLGIRVRASAITHVFLTPAFGELHGICFASHARECAAGWGAPAIELPLLAAPRSRSEAIARLAERVGEDVANRYARTFAAAVSRYAGDVTARHVGRVGELLTWLQALVEGRPDFIENPTARPDRRRAAGRAEGMPLREVRPQALLLLAALDPNIARLVSLSWIDRFAGPGHPLGPREGLAYDYKVEGRWREHELCGLLLGVGATVDGVPAIDPTRPVRAEKLRGVRWLGTEPRYRVGVRWSVAEPPPGPARAVRPVAFDVWRRRLSPSSSPPVLLTGTHPVVVGESGWRPGGPPHLVDPGVPRGTFAYHVAGIDIFGQTGAEVPPAAPLPGTEGTVTLADLEAPPAPSRLAALLIQPGYPWLTPEDRSRSVEPARAVLRFRYGASQYRQAPDVASFSVYWRRGRLVDAPVAVTAEVVSDTPVPGDGEAAAHRYVVEVLPPPANLERFAGGTLSSPAEGEDRPPASARRHLRIARAEGSNRLELEPSTAEIAPGPTPYLLAGDPHRRESWAAPIAALPARPPVPGAVRPGALASAFGAMRVRAWPVPAPTARTPDPYALLAAGAGPAPDPVEEGVEVLVDRTLLEADLFTEGRAETGGRVFDIVASSAGRAYGEGVAAGVAARIWLRPADSEGLEVDIAPGAELWLYARGHDLEEEVASRALVTHVEIDATTAGQPQPPPGGELGFDVQRDGEPGERIHVVGEVVSDVDWRVNRLGLLVRFPPSLLASDLPGPGTRVTFFPDYVTEFALAVQPPASSGPAGLQLPIAAGEAASSAYFAVSSTDLRHNEGRLSSPAQVTAVKPPPRGRPGAPFPCGHPDRDGYATPPNRDGRASVCVAWVYDGPPGEAVDLRYDVGRALDQTIIATDRRNWLIGRAPPGAPPRPGLAPSPVSIVDVAPVADSVRWRITAELGGAASSDEAFADGLLWQERAFPLEGGLDRTGSRVSFDVSSDGPDEPAPGQASLCPLPVPPVTTLLAEVQSVSSEGDLYRIALEDPGDGSLDADEVAAASGGCLVQDGPSGRPPARFQITRVSAEGDLVMLLRPMAGDQPARAPCRIELPPDYSRLRGKPHKLRQLADKPGNEDAFGVVTGVPVTGTTFRDEIPGAGRSAFFYRARAVDAANNHSGWSPTSAPFWQVDTTPPAAPGNFQVFPGRRSATLMWSAPTDATVTRFCVYRRPDGADGADAGHNPAVDVPLAATRPRAPVVVGGGVSLPAHDLEAVDELTEVLVAGESGSPVNVFVSPLALTRLEGRRIEGLNPLVAGGTLLSVVVDTEDGPRALSRRPGSGEPLVLDELPVELTFGLEVASIRGLYRARDVPDGAAPGTALALPDLLGLAEDATIDLVTRSISGLAGAIPDGLAVVVVVELADGALRVLRHAPGTSEPLRVTDGAVHLDLAIHDDSLLEVTALDGPHAQGGRGAPPADLRLTTASRLRVDPASGLVTGVMDLNPLVADGTAVTVTFRDARGVPRTYAGDRAIVTWRDEPLEADRGHTYELAAVRETWMASPRDGALVMRSIRSARAGPVRAVPLPAVPGPDPS